MLVEDEKIFSVAIDLEQKPSIKSIKLLSEIFQDKLEQIEIESIVKKSIASGNQEIVLSKLSLEQLSKFLVRNNELNGFSILENYKRVYNSHPSIFHVLGHLGYINQSDEKYFMMMMTKMMMMMMMMSIWSNTGAGQPEIYLHLPVSHLIRW